LTKEYEIPNWPVVSEDSAREADEEERRSMIRAGEAQEPASYRVFNHSEIVRKCRGETIQDGLGKQK